jgi:negative regulator of sigma-B (phosphoserine phosphatase)
MEAVNAPLIEWGAASLTLPGQVASGDLYVVKPFPDGVLVAVVDGLGHGPEAADAAALTVHTLESHAREPVIGLVERCHDRLRGTRGAVVSLASFSARDNTMTWLGVGNVEGVLLRRPEERTGYGSRDQLLLRGGVLGALLPPLVADTLPVVRGDTLILASDGIRSGFAGDVMPTISPQHIADRILAVGGKGTDDALVLVTRYLGAEGTSDATRPALQ